MLENSGVMVVVLMDICGPATSSVVRLEYFRDKERLSDTKTPSVGADTGALSSSGFGSAINSL